MKLSFAGQLQLAAQKDPFMVSFADLAVRFKERGIYPRDGRAVRVDGTQLSNTTDTRIHTYEERVNQMLLAVRNAVSAKANKADHGVRNNLEEAEKIAFISTDPYELQYLAAMFIDQRMVIKAMASNPSIDEKTQRIIATDAVLKGDVLIQRTLASNRGLHSGVMELILRESDDSYIHREIAENAAGQARRAEGESPFSAICDALTRSPDSAVRQLAIGGVRDATRLRELSQSRSAFLVPRELEAVADNTFTPDDVLTTLASTAMPSLQAVFAIGVAKKARMSLNARRYHADLAPDSPTPA